MNDQVEKLKRLNGELCKMLEERGVKCEVLDFLGVKAVVWDGNVCRWVALPDEGGLAVAVYKDYLTPGQAIAATLGVDVKDCEDLLWEFIGALDVADATDADKKPIVSDYARHIAATLGSEREKELEQLIRDYHDATGALLTEHDYLLACGFEQRMRELRIEVER